MKHLLFSLICFMFFTNLQAQNKFEELIIEDQVMVKYKWKANAENEIELYLKLINKDKNNQNLELELGLYHQGILEERIELAECLKKGFWNNWFRKQYLFGFNETSISDYSLEDIQLEVIQIKTSDTEECPE